MKRDEGLKNNLIADVENICMIDLSEETAEMLKRCFEITIGTHNLVLPSAESAEEILLKHIGKAYNNKSVFHQRYLDAMQEFAALTAGKMVEDIKTIKTTLEQIQLLIDAAMPGEEARDNAIDAVRELTDNAIRYLKSREK